MLLRWRKVSSRRIVKDYDINDCHERWMAVARAVRL